MLTRKHPPRPVKTVEHVTLSPRPIARGSGLLAAALALPDGGNTAQCPKANPLRDKSYRRWVASLPCAMCGVEGYSQAAHGDQGKGLGIKSSDETCYPACGPRPSLFGTDPGCHWLIGTSGRIPRDDRRRMETEFAEKTRALWATMQP